MSKTAELAPRSDASEAIFLAAEAVFATNGFDGATTRAIADVAGVNAALIHYYFGSKEQLYETVYSRRSDEVNRQRRLFLSRLRNGVEPPSLEAVLDALVRPAIELGRDVGRGGHHYARLLCHVATGMDDRSKRLTKRQYDGIAREFVAALEEAVPGLSRKDAVYGYLQAIWMMASLMAETGRARILTGEPFEEEELDDVIGRAVAFSAAGMRALAAKRQGGRRRSNQISREKTSRKVESLAQKTSREREK